MENHVGMDCCMICGEPKSIALATKYKRNKKGELEVEHPIPSRFSSGPELCDKCMEKMKENNTFIMYEAEQVYNAKAKRELPQFTGRYLLCNMDAVDKSFESYEFLEKNRFILCLPEEFNKFIGEK